MLTADYRPLQLRFKETAITSRASMQEKESFVVRLTDTRFPDWAGFGECALFRGLSREDTPEYEDILAHTCAEINRLIPEAGGDALPPLPSLRFGFEMALANLYGDSELIPTATPFTRGEEVIRINGLIWMGDKATMQRRIASKIDSGFRCVKLKIGGIRFEDELELLRAMRREFSAADLELRVDANGAFTPGNAMERLNRLAELSLHSIEQPIKPQQPQEMARLCATTPLPIALDEELIGFTSDEAKRELLELIRPQYIILKPSLCGGFREADSWIATAGALGIGWWATSALESNLGLDAIARWVSRYPIGNVPQGLGTGALYTSNFSSHLIQEHDYLRYAPDMVSPDIDINQWF